MEKAEGFLLEIRQSLDKTEEAGPTLGKLTDEFYNTLPHTRRHRLPVVTKRELAKKLEICQVRNLPLFNPDSAGTDFDVCRRQP